tara:strand:+ start:63 stop:917 length:855 start_codon:yes stop_codon:yes gene_type:complete
MINVAESTDSSEPSNEIMISGRQHMVQIMKKAIRNWEERCNFEPAAVLSEPESFRFRHFEHKFTENAVVGQVSENIFFNMCNAALHDAVQFTRRLTKNGEWVVLAWSITSTKGRTQSRGPNTNPEKWDRFQFSPSNYGGGAPSPQRTQFQWVEIDQLVLTYCVIDNFQNEELDMHMERHGRPDVTMVKYLETGDHKYLPPALRDQRRKALDLLEQYVGGGQAKSKGPMPLTAAQYRQVKMLRGAGEKWKDIAESFGVSWTSLRSSFQAAEDKEGSNGSDGVGQA